MNVEMLRKVKKEILKAPARFNMDFFGDSLDWAIESQDEEKPSNVLGRPACKTQACIAGEACLVAGKAEFVPGGGLRTLESVGGFAETAQEILGLGTAQAQRLFYMKDSGAFGWPRRFEKEYIKARTPRARVLVAARRIEHFIKTNGKE